MEFHILCDDLIYIRSQVQDRLRWTNVCVYVCVCVCECVVCVCVCVCVGVWCVCVCVCVCVWVVCVCGVCVCVCTCVWVCGVCVFACVWVCGVCVCALCLLRYKRNMKYMIKSGWLCALAALSPDVLEQNFNPQYCSGCLWQNRNPFVLTTKYLVWLIKCAALLCGPVCCNVILISYRAHIHALIL